MNSSFFRKFEKLFSRPGVIFCLIILGLSLFLLKYFQPETNSPLLLTIGRLHPIWLHFPLVLILLLLILEILNISGLLKGTDTFIFYTFLTALFFTLGSILSGYFLYSSGEYAGFLMDQHYLGALVTGSLLLISLALFSWQKIKPKLYPLYLIILILTNLAAFYTGHQGGSITHGKDYLTAYMPMINPAVEVVEPDSVQYLYEDIIQPIFETKCAGCHHSLRSKGGFSVASLADLFKKGESGKMPILHFQADSSELIKRLLLPDTLAEHMPPPGKTPLDKKEIAILKYWIAKGANAKFKIADIKDSTQYLINQIAPALKKYQFNLVKAKLTAIETEEALMALGNDLEVSIKKDPREEGNKYTLSNKFPPAPFDSKKLVQLKPYLDLFTKVSLVATQIDDSDLYYFAQMSNLKELYLQKTKIKGFGLIQLKQVPELKILNISYTETDDKALLDLIQFPAIKEVFLYSTQTTPDVMKALEKYKPGLKINSDEGPYF